MLVAFCWLVSILEYFFIRFVFCSHLYLKYFILFLLFLIFFLFYSFYVHFHLIIVNYVTIFFSYIFDSNRQACRVWLSLLFNTTSIASNQNSRKNTIPVPFVTATSLFVFFRVKIDLFISQDFVFCCRVKSVLDFNYVNTCFATTVSRVISNLRYYRCWFLIGFCYYSYLLRELAMALSVDVEISIIVNAYRYRGICLCVSLCRPVSIFCKLWSEEYHYYYYFVVSKLENSL